MNTDIPTLFPSSALLKVTGARAHVNPRVCAPSFRRRGTPTTAGLSLNPAARPAPPPRTRLPAPPRALLAPPAPSRALHRPPAWARLHPASPWLPGLPAPPPPPPPPPPPSPHPPSPHPRLLPELPPHAVQSPRRRGVPDSEPRAQREQLAGLALGVCPSDGRLERAASWTSVDKTDTVKTAKNRQNGRLLMSDPKEKVTIESNEAMSDKCLSGHRPRLTSKLNTPPTQISLNVAKTFSEKKEVPSKNIENKVSLKNIENRVSSRSIKSKDILTNLQSDLLSSSCLKESTGEVSKDAVTVNQEKNNEYCLQDIDDKLSESAEDDDDEDDTNDEDNDQDSNPKKNTQAPLELMAEFLRAEMAREYQLAKKLCQMILIYEPENPEAKEFFTLIEEMLLMEKTQNHQQDGEDSDEDSSGESKGESDEELSDESSDEGEDGS
ncbi:PREDICTED: LOW QUALITY PROTEIN: glutamate-rich protein 2 [Cercocebus atys]|uniref:LOW QUALITY PROTEIN: glutamate-rich protein 2 n=1 Tax=Cercocebus atys TaxID=9531 RepID=UPI0005F504F5|nr:PREDICTED: LOW QUALITY PROTEIN: glutamate-rich protein 2 [Cercocebus atys]